MSNRFLIVLTGTICIGFILCGLIGILEYFIVKVILGSLFLFLIANLFYVNLFKEKREDG